MPTKAKLPILILLILAFLSLAGGLFYFLEKERARAIALQQELDNTKVEKRVVEEKLEEVKRTLSGLESKLQESQAQVDALSRDLEQEKNTKQEALTQVDRLKTELEQQKGLGSELENKLNQAQQDMEKLRAQIKELESKKTELEVKTKERDAKSQGVELGTILVGPEGASPLAVQASAKSAGQQEEPEQKDKEHKSGIEGKALVINKDYDFMVINLGSKDGVDLGDVFAVYHNNKYVGDIKIEKIHDSMSAAGFLSQETKHKVSEGDRVVQKIK